MISVPYLDLAALKAEYAPYDRNPIFDVGMVQAFAGTGWCSPVHGVDQQAYDRGRECGMRARRAMESLNGVGLD